LYLTIKRGLSFATTGVIVMVASLLGIPGSILVGEFSDKYGRKEPLN